MKKKILLALLIVVILLGVGGAYAYFATDVLKTGKEIFFSCMSADLFSELQDEKITEYIKKQEETAYINKGEMSINVSGNSDSITTEENLEILNKSKITFDGKTDNSKRMAEQTITVDFSQGFNIPINFRRDGNTFGIQSNFLDSKFIAVRNENLKALLERFDIDAEEMPDKIEFSQEQFTNEEIKTLQEKYVGILEENLEEELFSKEKVNNQIIVTAKVPEEKCKEILIKILETVRNDEIVLNKISGIYKKEEIQEQIDELIEELRETEVDENDVLEIRLYIEAKNMKKIEIAVIEDNTTTMLMTVEKNANQIIMKIYEETTLIGELSILKETSGNDVSYSIQIKVNSAEEGNVEMSFKLQYKNIVALDNVEENYEIKLSYEETDEYSENYRENIEINLNYKNLKTFNPNVEIEELNADNSTIINDATDKEIEDLLITIYKNLGLM